MQYISFNLVFACYTCTLILHMKSGKWIHACSSAALCGCFSLYSTENISFKSLMENKQQMLWFLPHNKTKRIVSKIQKEKRPVTGNWTYDIRLVQPVLCHGARTSGQAPPLTILYMYCEVGTEMPLSRTQSSCHSSVPKDWLHRCHGFDFWWLPTSSNHFNFASHCLFKYSAQHQLTWSKSPWSVSNE